MRGRAEDASPSATKMQLGSVPVHGLVPIQSMKIAGQCHQPKILTMNLELVYGVEMYCKSVHTMGVESPGALSYCRDVGTVTVAGSASALSCEKKLRIPQQQSTAQWRVSK